ncbi:hypothetical protein IQ215_07210 [Cyanobacterium stanieri LEGE 03274]|uniref:Lipopolysaccharide assembly protein A domain-containing protein n=1 Tax=Cyanobacterium stanieri LEGE 03274 TaxID=1828756 RepID=A0ABR9V6K9_9CHRO|nr:hypothetical protein [Cyanobacterium stanieri]MBE9222484.1 hypothetical protein [Cyanobacterium stanieri LEGE 03274]
MNFKSLTLITFFLLLILLLVQNSQAIPIIILGNTAINIPLSIVIFSGFLGGIISTLIIKFLVNLSSPKIPKSNNYKSNYPNQPSPPEPQEYSRTIEEKYHPNYQPKYQDDPIYPDELDIENKPSPNNIETIENNHNNTPELEEINQEKNQPSIEEKKETPIDTSSPLENSETATQTNQKTRQAAPYSYQPRERTEIVPKTAKIPPRQPSRTVSEDIYEATYRVITPPYQEEEDFDEFNEEDWDI